MNMQEKIAFVEKLVAKRVTPLLDAIATRNIPEEWEEYELRLILERLFHNYVDHDIQWVTKTISRYVANKRKQVEDRNY